MTSPNKSGDVFSAIMCLVTGQQFRYSHNLPHTCIIMEVHRKPDLASTSFVLNDNHLFPSHSYLQLETSGTTWWHDCLLPYIGSM